MSYEEMYDIYRYEGKRYFHEIFPLHLAKAKREKDTIQWATAHRYRSWDFDSMEMALKSLDTAVSIIKQYKTIDQTTLDSTMASIHYARSAVFHYNDLDEKVVQELLKSLHLSKRSNRIGLMVNTLCHLAYLKAAYGEEIEGIQLQRKTLEFVRKRHKHPEYESLYLECTFNLGYCYLFAAKLDSAGTYINKSIELADELGDKFYNPEDLAVLKAQLDYYEDNFEKARDSLTKYAKMESGTTKADRYYYLGMIEGKLGHNPEKMEYFSSIDSIMKAFNYPLIDNINEVYQFLLKDAIIQRNEQKEREYLDILVHYDSLLTRTQNRLEEITLKELDVPLQEEETSILHGVISSKNKLIQLFYFLLALSLFGLSSYYLKYKSTKNRLVYAMNHPVKVNTRNDSDLSAPPVKEIEKSVLQSILEKLDQWESQKKFLNHAVSQQSLAKNLGTNSAYLSQAINHHKGQNFASYLKDLRITYAINNLKENPILANTYSMVQIAEMYGFNSITVFNKALKSKIGVTPGAFLRELSKAS
ncbi:helix-turn-helix domain-containing protein [Flagellimonas sp. 2504JD4-2]